MNRIFSNITLSVFMFASAVGLSFMTACSPATETKNGENKPAASGGQNNANTVANIEKKPEAHQVKQDDALPKFEKEEDYKTSVREKLLKAGWSPARSEDEGKENCVAGSKACEEFPELEAGPSSPQGAAIFRWEKGDKILLVHALDDPLFYSWHEFEKPKKTPSAQTSESPVGKYVYTSKHEYGTDIVYYEIKPGNVAFFESEMEGQDSAKLKGTWFWNETDKILTVKFDNDVYEFKLEGKNLTMINEPKLDEGAVGWKGTIFKKQ